MDYTSRDYLAIRQDLINLIPSFAPQWINRDPADFGMTLVELFSYMGDMLSYYIDRSANESFITTATQRENVISIASLLGYTPTSIEPATTVLTFSNSTDNPITIPAGTQVADTTIVTGTTTQIIYETDAELTIPARSDAIDGTNSVTATQGETVVDTVTSSASGDINQNYKLTTPYVVAGSLLVDVSSTPYTLVEHLIDYSGYDAVFSYYVDGANYTYVTFGDGSSGRVPPSMSTITVTYRVCNGAIGNVNTGVLTNIVNVPGLGIVTGLSATNLISGTGGSDPETTDSIRYNAPLSIKALNRAVTLSDYASLAVGVTGIYKAIAVGEVYTNVTLYFLPQGDTGLDPSTSLPSTVFNTRATTLATYFQDKMPANTSLTFQPPSYVPTDIILKVTLLPIARQATVQTAISTAINSLFDVTRTYFNQRVTMQDIYNTISLVPGVSYVQVAKLIRYDQDLTYNIIKTQYTASGNVATLTTGTTAQVTAASAAGGTVTYTAANTFTAGQTVSITGLTTTAFNLTDVTIATSSSTQFTVTNAATGTAVTGATAYAAATVPHSLQVGQTVQIGSINSTYNGTFVVTGLSGTTAFTYKLLAGASNLSSTLLNPAGAMTLLSVGDIICAPYEIPTLNASAFSAQLSGGILN